MSLCKKCNYDATKLLDAIDVQRATIIDLKEQNKRFREDIDQLNEVIHGIGEDRGAERYLLEANHLVIEWESDELVLECLECGFPYGEGHADDCKIK